MKANGIGALPIRLAYQWLVLAAVVIVVPLVWLLLFDVFTAISSFFMDLFPKTFSGNSGAAASFQYNIWYFFPLFALVAGLIWLVNETLKERRREAYEID